MVDRQESDSAGKRSKTHVVALSGGKDSTALAIRLREISPGVDYRFVCTPTGNELPEMIAHWQKLRAMLGNMVAITSGKSIQGLIRSQRHIPNWRQRWCTRMLKIEPFAAYLADNAPCVAYVGIRADETQRDGVDYSTIDGVEYEYPLVQWGWGLSDVEEYLRQKGVEIPDRTDCAMCFFQTVGEWWNLWRWNRELYREAEKYERWVGHTLRSDTRDTWPAALRDLRIEFERGKVPRGSKIQGELFRGMDARKKMCGICAR